MAGEQKSALLLHLRKVIETEAARQLSDGEALRRFAAQREEAAFATLMQRHGPLVMGVCRHFLRHEQDAEDAFQATFLVLARQAGSIRKEHSVASWLYGVAYRIAMKARRSAARRRRHEAQAPAPAEAAPAPDNAWRELQALLDEELNRLPEKYRTPFVLCCLEAKSKKEAAEELGWKEGTVSSRLAQARKLLQQRLARRGVELSAVLAGLAVAGEGVAAVPLAVAVTVLQASLWFAAGGPEATARASAQAAAWAQAALRSLALGRAKLPAVLLLLLALTGGGAAALLWRPPPPPRPAAPAAPADGQRAEAIPAPGPDEGPDGQGGAEPDLGKMTVAGHVFFPGKRPAPRVPVVVVTNQIRRAGEVMPPGRILTVLLGSGITDEQGQFRLAALQTDVQRHSRPMVLAAAPGYALTPVGLDRLSRTHRNLQADLLPAQSARGRLVGLAGEPARGVRVRVIGMSRSGGEYPFDVLFPTPPGPLPGWLDPVTTDDDGRFVLAGLGPNLRVILEVADERYATQRLALNTGPQERAETTTLALAPVRTLEGRVTEADSGRPLAGAHVEVTANGGVPGMPTGGVYGLTDADGRYRLRPYPGKLYVFRVQPPAGSPYLLAQKYLPWPDGAARHQHSLAMRRGVLLQGRVIESGTRRPVAGAEVEYVRGPHPAAPEMDGNDPTLRWSAGDAGTGPDGSFTLAVFPGAGHLLVRGPTADYLHVETTKEELSSRLQVGTAHFPDALVPLKVPPAVSGYRVVAALRRGVTVRGRVEGQDGKPVAAGVMVSPTYVNQQLRAEGDPILVRDGRFELPGCDPERKVRVLFFAFDRYNPQGMVADIPGDPNAEPVVRLAPVRSTVLHITGPDGRPAALADTWLYLVLRDGVPPNVEARKGMIPRVTAPLSGMYFPGTTNLKVDEDGRVRLIGLIPGAMYEMRLQAGMGRVLRTLITVPTGPGPVEVRTDANDPP
jgi:RNA polymerase sigma factor (sigma-70 family)